MSNEDSFERASHEDEQNARLLTRLAESRSEKGMPLTTLEFEKLSANGMRDFSAASLASGTAIQLISESGSPFIFRNTAFAARTFDRCDLRGADFRDSDMTKVFFRECRVAGADFSSICIQGELLDLNEGAVTLTHTAPFYEMRSAEIIEACTYAEERYEHIFEGTDKRGRGIVIKQGDDVLGVLKLHVERNFLPMRTSRNPDGSVVFWKGGLYALDMDFVHFLLVLIRLKQPMGSANSGWGVWPVIDLDEALVAYRSKRGPDQLIGTTLLRFLDDPSLMKKLPEWQKITEGSKNTVSFKEEM